MYFGKLILILACVAAMAGCSADPYKGRVPAPPDRLQKAVEAPAMNDNPSATGSVPIGDGSESAAPNYSGNLPRVSVER